MGLVGGGNSKEAKAPRLCLHTRPLLPPPRVLDERLHPEEPPPLQWVGPAPGAHVLGTTEKPLLSTPVPIPGPDGATLP